MRVWKRRAWRAVSWSLLLTLGACASDTGDDESARKRAEDSAWESEQSWGAPQPSERPNSVSINGVKVEPGPPKDERFPEDGPCGLKFGVTTTQEARTIFGEPTSTAMQGGSEILAYNYGNGLLMAMEFRGDRLNNFTLTSADTVSAQCLPIPFE